MNRLWVRGVEFSADCPLVDVLADALIVSLVLHGGCSLAPTQQGLEVDFIASLDHDVGDFTALDGASDRPLAYAKHLGGFRDGKAYNGLHMAC